MAEADATRVHGTSSPNMGPGASSAITASDEATKSLSAEPRHEPMVQPPGRDRGALHPGQHRHLAGNHDSGQHPALDLRPGRVTGAVDPATLRHRARQQWRNTGHTLHVRVSHCLRRSTAGFKFRSATKRHGRPRSLPMIQRTRCSWHGAMERLPHRHCVTPAYGASTRRPTFR